MDEIIQWLTKLINYNTTASGTDAEACVDFIERTLTAHGVAVRAFLTVGGPREAHHLLAEIPGRSTATVMLHAHLDTADFGNRNDWLFSACRASRRVGCVCGRGALDCKGPVAVWMKLMCDAASQAPLPYTLKLLVSDLEEEGGQNGLGRLLPEHPEILDKLKLVIGEGGGFPFPYHGQVFYTFQTEEREAYEDAEEEAPDREHLTEILSIGIEKGYYSADILTYASQASSISGRKLDIHPLYSGMEAFFANAPFSDVYGKYGPIFESALRSSVPEARLMPCITPGYSDNRWFRKAGIPVIGFFPLDIRNSLGGIHGKNEYISEGSLRLAYKTVADILKNLPFSDN